MGTMKAWVLTEKKKMELETRPIPDIQGDEVLVKVQSVGICGSDLHYYTDGKIGGYVVKAPLVLGHECSGIVTSAGANVKNVKKGDRVVLEPGIGCGKCYFCKNGKYNHCVNLKFMAAPPFDGCLCEYMAWPADLAYKMHDGMSFQEGALVEPFTVALQTLRLSEFKFSSSAVVVGTGTIGLMMIQTLKAVGAGAIIAVDISPFKLEKAKVMGATDVVDSTAGKVSEKVKELTEGLGAMFGYETCGRDETFYEMASLVRDASTITLVGLLPEDGTKMPMASGVLREIRYHTMSRYTNVFAEALTMLKYGRVDINPALTHQFHFNNAWDAFEEARTNKKDAIKVMINME
jgi:L-iditol 2-dehydrogenase